MFLRMVGEYGPWFIFYRNLKKAEDKLKSLQDELEENKENITKMEKSLSELEEEATKVLEAYQESQVYYRLC